MRIATQSQVTTKVNAIKNALNSFSYTHKCIYYYKNSSIDSSWSTNVTLPNDGKSYQFLLCYTFSANALQASSSSVYKAGMIIDLNIAGSTKRVVQGFSSACMYQYNSSKNNISTGVLSVGVSGNGQSVPVSITLTKVNNSTLQEEAGYSGFQLAVIERPEGMDYERL